MDVRKAIQNLLDLDRHSHGRRLHSEPGCECSAPRSLCMPLKAKRSHICRFHGHCHQTKPTNTLEPRGQCDGDDTHADVQFPPSPHTRKPGARDRSMKHGPRKWQNLPLALISAPSFVIIFYPKQGQLSCGTGCWKCGESCHALPFTRLCSDHRNNTIAADSPP